MKGLETLLDAMEEVVDSPSPAIHLSIVGDGDPAHAAMLQKRVEKSVALRGRVEFLGRRSDIPVLLANSDLFVHPALFEAQGLAVLEAAAMGLPIVASHAVKSVIDSAIVCNSFPGGSSSGLASSLSHAIANIEELTSMARAAHGDIRRRYSIAGCADQYLRLLDEACLSPASPQPKNTPQ
jgi:glycosyltransferase involved in cell wall biosynthesis